MTNIKRILFPTDFSETALQAFRYAHALAQSFGEVEIKIVHVFMPAIESEYPNFAPPVAEYMKSREEMLQNFVEECRQQEEGDIALQIASELLIGFPAEEIVKQGEAFDLIVMGTTGQTHPLDRIFGSVSSAVARRSDQPVLLVPHKAAFRQMKHILYATNYESANETTIEQLMDFNANFNACIHFVHVREDGENNYNKTKEDVFDELLGEGEIGFSFEMADIEGESVVESLGEYAKEHAIDLVVLVNQRRNFWESIFHKSQTKEMALTTHIPMLVYHVD